MIEFTDRHGTDWQVIEAEDRLLVNWYNPHVDRWINMRTWHYE